MKEAFHTLDYVLRPPSGTNVEALVAVVTSSGKGMYCIRVVTLIVCLRLEAIDRYSQFTVKSIYLAT
jgi:hypothetical protein